MKSWTNIILVFARERNEWATYKLQRMFQTGMFCPSIRKLNNSAATTVNRATKVWVLPVRIELTTSGLWDRRSTYWAKGAIYMYRSGRATMLATEVAGTYIHNLKQIITTSISPGGAKILYSTYSYSTCCYLDQTGYHTKLFPYSILLLV